MGVYQSFAGEEPELYVEVGNTAVFPLQFADIGRRDNDHRGDCAPAAERTYDVVMDGESAADLIESYRYEPGGVDSNTLAQWFGFEDAAAMLRHYKGEGYF